MHRTDIVSRIERERIVAVIRLDDPEKLRAVIDALAAGGVRVIEVTMTVPRAIELIGRLSGSVGDGVLLGAGTVLDADTARQAVDAGARFVVSPVFRRDVIAAIHERGVPAMPGCFTPTEIFSIKQRSASQTENATVPATMAPGSPSTTTGMTRRHWCPPRAQGERLPSARSTRGRGARTLSVGATRTWIG